MSSRSPRPNSSRSHSSRQSSRSQSSRSPTPSSSRSSSVTPSNKRSTSTKSPKLLYIYGGIAAFLLFAILTNLVFPVKIDKLADQCKDYTKLPDDNVTEVLHNFIKEGITKIELIAMYIENTTEIIDDEEMDAAIRKLYFYEDDDNILRDCRIPVNPIGFIILAIILFLVFAVLAGVQYSNIYMQKA